MRHLLSPSSAARMRLLLAVIAGVGAAGAAVGLSATSAWLISRAADRPPVLELMVAIVAVRAFGIGRGALRYGERLLAHDGALRILARLRRTAYEQLERLAPAGLADYRSGDLLTRLVGDIDSLADVWLRLVLPYAIATIVAAGSVLLMGALLPAAGAALGLTLLFVALAVPVLAGLAARRAERRIAPARGELAAATLELLNGAPELLVAGAHEQRLAQLGLIDDSLRRAEGRSASGSGLGALFGGLAAGLAVWLALVIGVPAVADGRLAGVFLAVVVLTPIAAHELVAGLAEAAQHLPGLRASGERVAEILRRSPSVVEPARPAPVPAGPVGLRLRGLSARYTPDGPDVLDGVDLELAAGEWALVTGPSGSGKTTLAAVLLRFIEPSAGSVELTGAEGVTPLDALAGDDARSLMALCSQDVHLFDSTLADNVRLARPVASDAELLSAMRQAGLGDWIASLPDGLGTTVGEHGVRLSGGQRQRVALARALLADRPLLIFDEPTEHLDQPTAAALTRDLLAAARGRTALFMTHRPELMAAVQPARSLRLGHRPAEHRRAEAPIAVADMAR
jgi:thiol reductant ABC exporter CydC subunit